MQDRHQACPCCSALPTPQPHRSGSHQSLDCGRLGQHRSPKCCHCAASPKRRPAHATRPCRPACLTQRILRNSQVAPTQSMLLPHSPAAVSLPTCIHPAELHSHSQAAFTSPMQPNQPNKPTICIPTHSFAHRGAPSQMRACTRPVHLFEAQRSCSNVLHGAAHNQNLRCCTHPALRPTSAAFRAATARGACTPALTVGVHPASSNERAECDCPGRPWRWLHPTYHPPRDVSFSRSRRQYHPQLVVGLRHRLPCIYLLHMCTEQRHRPTAAHSKKSGATYELTSRCTAQMRQFVGWCDGVAVCTRSRMPFTRRRSRGYFRDSSTDVLESWVFSRLRRRGVGIFDTPQKGCGDFRYSTEGVQGNVVFLHQVKGKCSQYYTLSANLLLTIEQKVKCSQNYTL